MSSTEALPKRRDTYLVLLDDYLVMQDLAETIACHDSGAKVLALHRISDAMEALKDIDRIAVAFVGIGPKEFAASGLACMIAGRKGRVVLLGNAAEDAADTSSWAVLHRPFSQGIVLKKLSGLGSG